MGREGGWGDYGQDWQIYRLYLILEIVKERHTLQLEDCCLASTDLGHCCLIPLVYHFP